MWIQSNRRAWRRRSTGRSIWQAKRSAGHGLAQRKESGARDLGRRGRALILADEPCERPRTRDPTELRKAPPADQSHRSTHIGFKGANLGSNLHNEGPAEAIPWRDSVPICISVYSLYT